MMLTADVPLMPEGLLVAFTVTTLGVGMAAGAVYRPLAVMVPTVALPPTMPFTLQVTPLPPVVL